MGADALHLSTSPSVNFASITFKTSLKNQVPNVPIYNQVSLERDSVLVSSNIHEKRIQIKEFLTLEDRLKQKVLGKDEVFYGGQLFNGRVVAPPATKVHC